MHFVRQHALGQMELVAVSGRCSGTFGGGSLIRSVRFSAGCPFPFARSSSNTWRDPQIVPVNSLAIMCGTGTARTAHAWSIDTVTDEERDEILFETYVLPVDLGRSDRNSTRVFYATNLGGEPRAHILCNCIACHFLKSTMLMDGCLQHGTNP